MSNEQKQVNEFLTSQGIETKEPFLAMDPGGFNEHWLTVLERQAQTKNGIKIISSERVGGDNTTTAAALFDGVINSALDTDMRLQLRLDDFTKQIQKQTKEAADRLPIAEFLRPFHFETLQERHERERESIEVYKPPEYWERLKSINGVTDNTSTHTTDTEPTEEDLREALNEAKQALKEKQAKSKFKYIPNQDSQPTKATKLFITSLI
jgi:hypothetical protein